MDSGIWKINPQGWIWMLDTRVIYILYVLAFLANLKKKGIRIEVREIVFYLSTQIITPNDSMIQPYNI